MALKKRTERVGLDTANDYVGDAIWAVQGEQNALELVVDLSQAGEAIDLEGVDVTFRIRPAVGSIHELQLGTDAGIERLTTEVNRIKVVPPAEVFTRNGFIECEVLLVDTANGITLKTPTFKLFALQSIE